MTDKEASRPARFKKEERVHFVFSDRPFDVEEIYCIEGGYIYLHGDAQDEICKTNYK